MLVALRESSIVNSELRLRFLPKAARAYICANPLIKQSAIRFGNPGK